MEMYFTPSESAVTDKEQVLAAFTKAGLAPEPELDGSFWIVGFAGSEVFVSFQERDGSLSFATFDQPMLSGHDVGHQVFCALQDMGWIADEDVG